MGNERTFCFGRHSIWKVRTEVDMNNFVVGREPEIQTLRKMGSFEKFVSQLIQIFITNF